MGNLPAAVRETISPRSVVHSRVVRTLGETGAEQTGNLLDEGLRGKESVVLLGQLLDELLVLVEPTAACRSGCAQICAE